MFYFIHDAIDYGPVEVAKSRWLRIASLEATCDLTRAQRLRLDWFKRQARKRLDLAMGQVDEQKRVQLESYLTIRGYKLGSWERP